MKQKSKKGKMADSGRLHKKTDEDLNMKKTLTEVERKID